MQAGLELTPVQEALNLNPFVLACAYKPLLLGLLVCLFCLKTISLCCSGLACLYPSDTIILVLR